MNLTTVRNVLITATALLTAASVAVSGCIGFVGLVIPHLVRSVVGPYLGAIPLSTLFGAIFLIWVDVGARIIHPQRRSRGHPDRIPGRTPVPVDDQGAPLRISVGGAP